jgi:transcriptional activator SPT7
MGFTYSQTSVEVPNDEGLFEGGDEADHFASYVPIVCIGAAINPAVFSPSGGLADILGGGEDFLGLRELGIEAEFGLKSLSIPKRLWKGKSGVENRAAPDRCVSY